MSKVKLIDSNRLVIGTEKGKVAIVSLDKKEVRFRAHEETEPVSGIAYVKEEDTLLVTSLVLTSLKWSVGSVQAKERK